MLCFLARSLSVTGYYKVSLQSFLLLLFVTSSRFAPFPFLSSASHYLSFVGTTSPAFSVRRALFIGRTLFFVQPAPRLYPICLASLGFFIGKGLRFTHADFRRLPDSLHGFSLAGCSFSRVARHSLFSSLCSVSRLGSTIFPLGH